MKRSCTRILSLLCALSMAAAMLGSCMEFKTNPESSVESSAESSEEKPSGLTAEDAEKIVKEKVPLDFKSGYTLAADDQPYHWNGREYHCFSISKGKTLMKLSVLVDRENGQIFTLHPDGKTYAPKDEPAFKPDDPDSESSAESESREESESSEAQTSIPPEWKGNLANPEGYGLFIEPLDTNSFEFDLLDPEGEGLTSQVARSEKTGIAVSTSTPDLEITFLWKNGKIEIKTKGTLPKGFRPDGEYSKDE